MLTEEKGPPIAVGLIRPLALLVALLLENHGSVCMKRGSWWPIQGDGYMLLVFTAVFIGGTSVFGGAGRLYGTQIGIAIVGMIEAGIASSGLSGALTRAVHGMVIIAAVSSHAILSVVSSIRYSLLKLFNSFSSHKRLCHSTWLFCFGNTQIGRAHV